MWVCFGTQYCITTAVGKPFTNLYCRHMYMKTLGTRLGDGTKVSRALKLVATS